MLMSHFFSANAPVICQSVTQTALKYVEEYFRLLGYNGGYKLNTN